MDNPTELLNNNAQTVEATLLPENEIMNTESASYSDAFSENDSVVFSEDTPFDGTNQTALEELYNHAAELGLTVSITINDSSTAAVLPSTNSAYATSEDTQMAEASESNRGNKNMRPSRSGEDQGSYENMEVEETDPLGRSSTGGEASFLGIAVEIRQNILQYLLTNPILSESLSVTKGDSCGKHTNYELHTAILLVCKSLHEEAMRVLYGDNTFYMALPSNHGYKNLLGLSPLTRYHHPAPYTIVKKSSLENIPMLHKVRNWKVIISAPQMSDERRSGPGTSPLPSLDSFCKSICRSAPRKLDIAIIPMGIELLFSDELFYPMRSLLQPLMYIRNVRTVIIRESTIFEVPDTIRQDDRAVEYISHMYEEPVLEMHLVLTMKSTEKWELVYEMYGPLLRYAQSFERYDIFKDQMALAQGQEIEESSDDGYYPSHPSFNDHNLDHNRKAFTNPFRGETPHPVEKHLMLAIMCNPIEDISAFKKHRKVILEYLEPQRQHLSSAAREIDEFIKKENTHYKLFDICSQKYVSQSNKKKISTAVELLEEFSTSFNRDIPRDMQKRLRNGQLEQFEASIALLESNIMVQRVVNSYKVWDLRRFIEFYQNAVDELYKQYMKIQAAKSELFNYDYLEERGVSLSGEEMYSLKMVDWTKCHPLREVCEDEFVVKRIHYSDWSRRDPNGSETSENDPRAEGENDGNETSENDPRTEGENDGNENENSEDHNNADDLFGDYNNW